VPAGERSSSDARGLVVDRFFCLRELGRGGMGVVFLAYDSHLDRRVAIKLMHDSVPWSEARAMARITHPNIVSVYEIGTHDGEPTS
jgi:serine/threonine protein kinase